MKKRLLSILLAAVMTVSIAGCNGKYKADNYTEEHSLFNVTYYIPKTYNEVERTSNGLKYTTEWGKISLITENSKSWDDKRVIDEMKKKSTRKNFDSIRVDDQPALYYEYEDDGEKGVIVHFNTNRSGCALDIQSNESIEQARVQYKEFISKVKIDSEKDKTIEYTQKHTIDNITYYLPENSTKSDDSKDGSEQYYVDCGMISVNKLDYIDPKMLHMENFIEAAKSKLSNEGCSGIRDEKKTINDKPVLCINSEFKNDYSENTKYQSSIYVCSDKNLVHFSINSYSLYDSIQKNEEFLEKLFIDNTKETTATVKTTKPSDYTKKETIDNITFYVPDNSTKNDKGDTYNYIEGLNMLKILQFDYKDTLSDDFRKLVEEDAKKDNITIVSCRKTDLGLLVGSEIKSDNLTGYFQVLYVTSNKHVVGFGLCSYKSMNDAVVMYKEFVKHIKIDKSQKPSAKDAFNDNYGKLPTWKDVKYDPIAYIGKKFTITDATYAIDDYYNFDYMDTEGKYFVFSAEPPGAYISDRWYIYADRSKFDWLFKQLKEGRLRGNIVVKAEYKEATKHGMATLVDTE